MQKKYLRSAGIATALSLVFFYTGNRYTELVITGSSWDFAANIDEAFSTLIPSLIRSPFHISTDGTAVLVGTLLFLTLWFVWARFIAFSGNYRSGEESGSATWGDIKEGEQFKDKENPFNNVLYTEHFGMALSRPKNEAIDKTLELQRNWNNLVIGGSGSGKTFGFVTPNLLQCYGDYFVTDPKGTLLPEVGNFMASQGYKIRSFNTINFSQSLHYNPLKYVKTDDEVLSFVKCLIKNTKGDGKPGDPFWEDAETLFYMSQILLLRDWFRPEDYTLDGFLTLLSLASASEENENAQSPLDVIFEQIEKGGTWRKTTKPAVTSAAFSRTVVSGGTSNKQWVPSTFRHNRTGVKPAEVGGLTVDEDFALYYYKEFKKASGKTLKSILISCSVRVAPFAITEVRELLKYDEMELDALGSPDQKTLIFAIMSDTKDTYSFLFAIMMDQAINLMCDGALLKYGGRMPRHVHFIFDEARRFYLPSLPAISAVIRSRNGGLDAIYQSVAQLHSQYDKEAEEIIDCCDTLLFLGGKSVKTNEEIAKMIGKETIHQVTYNESHGQSGSSSKNMQIQGRDLIDMAEVAKMSRRKAILLIAGANPLVDKKYPLHKHPNYKQMKQYEKEGFVFMEYWEARKARTKDVKKTVKEGIKNG